MDKTYEHIERGYISEAISGEELKNRLHQSLGSRFKLVCEEPPTMLREETIEAIKETRTGRFAGTLDMTDFDSFLKSISQETAEMMENSRKEYAEGKVISFDNAAEAQMWLESFDV